MSVHALPVCDFTVDPSHSRIGFAVRHAMVSKVRGAFNAFTASGHFDPADLATSRIEVDVEVASIDTRNADRDAHLVSGDFLAVAEHPRITFTSTEVSVVDDAILRVDGMLTVRGITQPVRIDFEYTGTAVDPFGIHRAGFEGVLEISRKDFGVTWNAPLETGGVLVADKVTLEFEISASLSPVEVPVSA